MPKAFKLLSLSFVLAVAVIGLGGSKANAATISVVAGTDNVAVDSSCTLSEAIQNINDQLPTNSDCAAGDGNSDTINLPGGTITLNGPLPNITRSTKIVGQGIVGTTINGNGFTGFGTDFAATPLTKDFSIEQLKMTNFLNSAIVVYRARSVGLTAVDIDDCDNGVSIAETRNILVADSIIRNNVSSELVNESYSGLFLSIAGLVSSDKPTISVDNTKIIDNKSLGQKGYAGLTINVKDDTVLDANQFIVSNSIVVHNTTITGNQAGQIAGLFVSPYTGPYAPAISELLVDSTTIANNSVVVPVPVVVNTPGYTPVIAGIYLSGKLNAQQNFTNVTIVNNNVDNPAPDNRNSIAGFFGTFGVGSADLKITNVTIVGNNITQPASELEFSAFSIFYIDLDFTNFPNIILNEVRNGAQVQNSVIARNLSSGNLKNCLGQVSLLSLGLNVTIDGTPTDLGGNVTDDPNCTGYNVQANLFSTLGPLQDNGGPVFTMALLPGSPAIGIAGQVLGISTDARGIARPATPDAGAYQTVLGANTDTSGGQTAQPQLPETGDNEYGYLFIALGLVAISCAAIFRSVRYTVT